MIPTISTEEVDRRLQHIKPVRFREGRFWLIKPPDPFKVTFLWSPEFIEPIPLEPVRKVETRHRFGANSGVYLFKPSIAEVLAQWPEDLMQGEFYFSTKLTKTDDEAIKAGHHLALTSIFKKRAV